MAEAEMGGERTEEPSQRRLQEARERGQVPRSRELTNFATMIGGSAALVAIGGIAGRAPVADDAPRSSPIDPQRLRDTDSMLSSLGDAVHQRRSPRCCRCSARSIVLVLLASVVLGGWNFSTQAHGAGFFALESARRD